MKNLIAVSLILLIASCSTTPSNELLKKGDLKIEASLGFPLTVKPPELGFFFTPFPEVGIKYGISNTKTIYFRNYPMFFYFGVLFFDAGIVFNTYHPSDSFQVISSAGITTMTSFKDIRIYPSITSSAVFGSPNSSRYYISLESIIDFHEFEKPVDPKINFKAGGIIPVSSKFNFNFELGLHSLGKTVFTDLGLNGIAIPVIYTGISYKFEGGEK